MRTMLPNSVVARRDSDEAIQYGFGLVRPCFAFARNDGVWNQQMFKNDLIEKKCAAV